MPADSPARARPHPIPWSATTVDPGQRRCVGLRANADNGYCSSRQRHQPRECTPAPGTARAAAEAGPADRPGTVPSIPVSACRGTAWRAAGTSRPASHRRLALAPGDHAVIRGRGRRGEFHSGGDVRGAVPQLGQSGEAPVAHLGKPMVDGSDTALDPAHLPAQQPMPRGQRQHPHHWIPSGLVQQSPIQHPGQVCPAAPSRTTPSNTRGILHASSSAETARTTLAPVTCSPPPVHGGWAPHRPQPATGPGRDAHTPVTTRPKHVQAGQRPHRYRIRRQRRCWRRRGAADAGRPACLTQPARDAAASSSPIISGRIGAPIRATKQVNQHEITRRGLRHGHPLELVSVERPHRHEIQRDHCAACGTWPTPPSDCSPGGPRADAPGRPHTPADPSRWSRCTSARRNPHSSPRRSPARAINNTTSRSLADRHARSSVRSPHRWRGPPPFPVPAAGAGPASATPYGPPRPGPLGQVTVVGHLIQQRHQTARGLPGGDRVHDHPPDGGQHAVDPRRRSRWRGARPGQHHTHRCPAQPRRSRRPARRGPTTS